AAVTARTAAPAKRAAPASIATEPATAMIAVPGVPAEAEPAAAPELSLAERARGQAAGVDATMRKYAPPARRNDFPPPDLSLGARLERAFDSAAVPRGTSVKNMVAADGTHYTRVTTSKGSYCIFGRSGRPSAAKDGTGFDTGYTTRTCPR
ncbi:MAG TPA: hypothetical protein VIT92_00950, partial [Burkholderiaceae bacterium]